MPSDPHRQLLSADQVQGTLEPGIPPGTLQKTAKDFAQVFNSMTLRSHSLLFNYMTAEMVKDAKKPNMNATYYNESNLSVPNSKMTDKLKYNRILCSYLKMLFEDVQSMPSP